MSKYALLRARVETADEVELLVPEAATLAELVRAHTQRYVQRVFEGSLSRDEVRRIGFPWSHELVERSRRSVGGTVAAARAAVEDGVAVNLAGGTHHAFPDRGEGFCVFNDVAVAARALKAERRGRRVAVLDLDVHQGNGTAQVFARDPDVFTLSVHGANNFPFRKAKSDLDLELPDQTGDDAYLDTVARGLRAALGFGPDLAFYLAGADCFAGDGLGRLAVTKGGMGLRDAMVLDRCSEAGVPVAVVMAGGYARDINDTVDIHHATVRLAARAAAGSLRT